MQMDAIYWSLVMLQNPGALVRDVQLPSQVYDTFWFDHGLRDQEQIARRRAGVERVRESVRKPRKKEETA